MKIQIRGDVMPETFVKRIFFLLYEACGDPMGKGAFQARDGATEDQVWQNVRTSGDYHDGGSFHNGPGRAYGDYVFGRMMKWGCSWDNETVTIRDREFRPDYQGFSYKYPDNATIANGTAKSLGVTVEVI